jgi:hypothetical protein
MAWGYANLGDTKTHITPFNAIIGAAVGIWCTVGCEEDLDWTRGRCDISDLFTRITANPATGYASDQYTEEKNEFKSI